MAYCHNSVSASAPAVAPFRMTSQFYSIQDSWKIRPNVTISYGLRYEYVPAWSDRVPLVNVWFPNGNFNLQGDPKGLNPQPADTQPCIIENGSGSFDSGNLVFPPDAQGGAGPTPDRRLGSHLLRPGQR